MTRETHETAAEGNALSDAQYDTMMKMLLARHRALSARWGGDELTDEEIKRIYADSDTVDLERKAIELHRFWIKDPDGQKHFTLPQCLEFLQRLKREVSPETPVVEAETDGKFATRIRSNSAPKIMSEEEIKISREVAGMLAELIEKSGMKIYAIALAMDPPGSTSGLSDLIKGKRIPKEETALRIVNALHLPEDDTIREAFLKKVEAFLKKVREANDIAQQQAVRNRSTRSPITDLSKASLGDIIQEAREGQECGLGLSRQKVAERVNQTFPEIRERGQTLTNSTLTYIEKNMLNMVILKTHWEDPLCAVLGLNAPGQEKNKACFHRAWAEAISQQKARSEKGGMKR